MKAFYNEFEPFAAEWLANLVRAGHITDGTVDARTILDVQPGDLAGYTRAHFFAGIGLWDHALALAGWPDDVPVWTGSCPCQPFSNAGARKGFDDERHLWPVWFRLIDVCRPPIVVGEQVSSPAGRARLDLVFSDLEGAGYSCGAADLCAAGVGAPHRRQRLYWAAVRGAVADPHEGGQLLERPARLHGQGPSGDDPARRGEARAVADAETTGTRVGDDRSSRDRGNQEALGERLGHGVVLDNPWDGGRVEHSGGEARAAANAASESGSDGDGGGRGARGGQEALGERSFDCGPLDGSRVAFAPLLGCEERHGEPCNGTDQEGALEFERLRGDRNPWDDVEWLPCRDGVYRPVESQHVKMVDGNIRFLGYLRSRTSQAQEVIRANPKADPREVLRALWQETRTQKDQFNTGRPGGSQETGVLQPCLHGGKHDGENQGACTQELSPAVREESGEVLLHLQQKHDATPRTSYRLQPHEQRGVQLGDVVRLLSPSRTLAHSYGDGKTSKALQALQQTLCSLGALLHPSDSLQEVWQSLGDEGQAWFEVGFDPGEWVMVRLSPLSLGSLGRVGKLRAYGNAIVPQVAATFLRSLMDVLVVE